MKQEAAEAGFYNGEHVRNIEKIKIVTVDQILKGERSNIPLTADVLKKAESASNDEQIKIQD